MSPEPKFTPDSFDHPDELLEAAARVTLRLALRCDWVEGCEAKADIDPDSWVSLYDRIQTLMGADVNSIEGEDEKPNHLMSRFAGSVANQIAKVPSIRVAVAAYLASTKDGDP
jgi:hypothetical protein